MRPLNRLSSKLGRCLLSVQHGLSMDFCGSKKHVRGQRILPFLKAVKRCPRTTQFASEDTMKLRFRCLPMERNEIPHVSTRTATYSLEEYEEHPIVEQTRSVERANHNVSFSFATFIIIVVTYHNSVFLN